MMSVANGPGSDTSSSRVCMASAASIATTTASTSTLSALSPAFTMIPSSVRRRVATNVTVSSAAATGGNVPNGGETNASLEPRKERSRARRQRKKKHTDAAATASLGSPTAQSPTGTTGEEAKPPAPRQRKQRSRKAAGPAQEAVSVVIVEEDKEKDACLLCADPIKFYAIGECNHHGICSKCSMRMRLIMDDRNCPMCKQPLDRVVVSNAPRAFESFELWGDAAGPESVLDEPSEMIFVNCRAHYHALRSLREFKCRMKRCHEVKSSVGQLKEHLRRDHGVEFCELCLTHQTFFIQEQEVFTKGTLKSHNIGRNHGGPTAQKHANTGKDFHPMCQFCRKRFYGDKELYEHLERDHFKCHICKVENEYFRN
ncbi:hypothetical protein BBJ28_00007476 [Nothophytophthora sp. Chile5]|nr:hypothetical protein BBJ28_00007476 [Nothophytophthora sp. Chile5]